MGVLDSIGNSVERFGDQILDEGGRVTESYAREFERIPVLGDPMKDLHDARVAGRQAANDARELQVLMEADLAERMARSATALRITNATRAREKRLGMAESIVGAEVGIMNSTPIAGPDLNKNRIPLLDPVDEMGNSIPEV